MEIEKGLFEEVDDHLMRPLARLQSSVLTTLAKKEERDKVLAWLLLKAEVLIRNEGVACALL